VNIEILLLLVVFPGVLSETVLSEKQTNDSDGASLPTHLLFDLKIEMLNKFSIFYFRFGLF
jgi:hypothetical protein